ncbi:PEP/pyruvate-binding domain-containing protein [bacterium]
MKRMMFIIWILISAAGSFNLCKAQLLTHQEITDMVRFFQEDPRGPFQAIRWFCPDGSVIPANQRCSQPGGIQHALHKASVQQLADQQGIYLAQILAGTPHADFWDTDHQFSRAKQYILEKYLFETDDGWILRQARYYRGAYQVEDEEAWGKQFFQWMLEKDAPIREQFFLLRQLARIIPHRAQNDHLLRIRTLSKEIADADSRFMDIRTKIHGQPESIDLKLVTAFRKRYQSFPDFNVGEKLIQLETAMETFYQGSNFENLKASLSRLPEKSMVHVKLKTALEMRNNPPVRDRCILFSDALWILRQELLTNIPASEKLMLLDLSIDIESLLFRAVSEWQPVAVLGLMEKAFIITKAAAACGFLEIWEWEKIAPVLAFSETNFSIALSAFDEKCAAYRRIVEWGVGMVHAIMEPAIQDYQFEPLAPGFIDHCLRSSVMLSLGESIGLLSDIASAQIGLRNHVMNISDAGAIRGLNPGYGSGQLLVYPGSSEQVQFSSQNIYALARAPASLTPVAGILTASEGNLVSHVQLLARNLGIPNAVLSHSHLQNLSAFEGTHVFYAVSPRGAVLMKPVSKMSNEERQLVENTSRNEDRIHVSVNRLRLNQTNLIPLDQIRSTDSGQLCGPKAANLGQLKQLFPEHVVNGIIIPFGVFDQHLNQRIPGRDVTYWQMLQFIFKEAERDRKNGLSELDIEKNILNRLAKFRDWLKLMPINAEFIADLKQNFRSVFNVELGDIPVFIRSDTNMEDLKDFTGAGLNLTVFNVLEKDKIIQGIRDVWISPFTERSYRWRQKYLSNPENVYPSILIMPSVNVEKSGVLITSGVSSKNSLDISVAFNHGVAGSVEGQISEQYLLKSDGTDLLVSPARELLYTIIPKTGGTEKKNMPFNKNILSIENRKQLREIAEFIKQRMTHISGSQSQGPYDVELGFIKDRLYLFQVRPFVENKKARSSLYLQSLDPPMLPTKVIRLNVPYKTLIN